MRITVVVFLLHLFIILISKCPHHKLWTEGQQGCVTGFAPGQCGQMTGVTYHCGTSIHHFSLKCLMVERRRGKKGSRGEGEEEVFFFFIHSYASVKCNNAFFPHQDFCISSIFLSFSFKFNNKAQKFPL